MSKKIGSKLAESLRQRRGNLPGEAARPEVTQPQSSPVPNAPVVSDQAGQSAPQEPSVSHGVLHPMRIWPD
ncbi:MAG: hypothetical protein M0Z84_12020 [Gammaproteobacteria bacterium]|nr:hypothetical protein [Gammaproteobacteria bacterium]